MSEETDTTDRPEIKLVQFDSKTEHELQWYFERGQNPELTRKQLERWTPIDRALHGRGRWLRTYFDALSEGCDRFAAQAKTEPVVAVGEYSALRAEYAEFVRRYAIEGTKGRGRPKVKPREFIVVAERMLVWAIPRKRELKEVTANWYLRPSVISRSKAVTAIVYDDLNEPSPWNLLQEEMRKSFGAIGISTWGDVRIDAAGSVRMAALLGLPPGKSDHLLLDAIEKHVQERGKDYTKKLAEFERLNSARKPKPAPKAQTKEYVEPLIDAGAVDARGQTRANAIGLIAKYGNHGGGIESRLLPEKALRIGSDSTNVTELAVLYSLPNTTVRNLLDIHYGEIVKGDEIPTAWLASPKAKAFLDAVLKAAKRRKVNYRTSPSVRNRSAKRDSVEARK